MQNTLSDREEIQDKSAFAVCVCVCVYVCFSECICLTSYVLAQLCGDEASFTGCTSRSLLSLRPDSSLSVCSSSRQPDSHRSPAQMPWPTLHVCKCVCVKKRACVCVCACVCLCVHTSC